MTLEERFHLLTASQLFADCTPEQIRSVATSAIVESYPIGAMIIREDTPSDYFYIIVEGTVDIYREEKHFLLETLSSGAAFGIMSLMKSKPRSATVEARAPTTVIKLELHYIRNSLPEGIEIYERILINHMNDLEAIVRSTNSLAINAMKGSLEEFKKRISFGKFFASLVLIITAHFCVGRFALEYIKGLGTTTFLTSGLLVFYVMIVLFMMKSTHYSWAEYGFTLANWRPCLADALVQSAVFILFMTFLKWGLLELGIFQEPLFELPFFYRYSLPFAILIVATYSGF